MKVKTLIILSILFFAIGSLGGAAYAFVSGGSVFQSVAGILPSSKTPEEKLIDDFIKEQEEKQSEDQQSPAPKEDVNDQKQDVTTKTPEVPSQPDKPDTADSSKGTNSDGEKRMGQPTVSDGTTLRVRKTPDAKNGEVLIGIPNTEKVEIVSEKNGWYQIVTANGTKGWVSAEYMKEI